MADDERAVGEASTSAEVDRLNDSSDYQLCFACGAQNIQGLRLHFWREGAVVVTEFTPDVRFQGFPGVVHGGIIATLLDETLNRTAFAKGRWMMTAKLEIRYKNAAPIGRTLRVTARPIISRSRLVTAEGEVTLADEPGTVLASAEGSFLAITDEYKRQAIEANPAMAGFFDQ